MSRIMFTLVGLVVVVSADVQAQPLTPLTTASGVGGFGGGVRPNTPALTAPTPGMTPRFGAGIGTGGGFHHHHPGFPFPHGWGQYRWFPYFGGYGYGYPYGYDSTVIVPVPYPVHVGPPAPPAQPPIMLSNEFPATLVLEFPAAAEVWVNGLKGEGEATNEWTLTSPVLKAGGEYTFEVKARWKIGEKTFEAERTLTVAGGKRTRAIVITGTEVKE